MEYFAFHRLTLVSNREILLPLMYFLYVLGQIFGVGIVKNSNICAFQFKMLFLLWLWTDSFGLSSKGAWMCTSDFKDA